MSTLTTLKGSCLCGTVHIQAQTTNLRVGACHCQMCQKWSGGPLLTVDCGEHIQINSDKQIAVFDSSQWAERAFCNHCGSHLYYRLKRNNHYIVPAGLFDGMPALVFDHQIFIDQKPAYYCFANSTQDMTAAEVYAYYGSQKN